MKKWDDLTKIGKRKRMSNIIGMLDCESSDKIFEKYDYILDNPKEYSEGDLDELAGIIYEENENAGNYNSRIYNDKIKLLLS